MPWFVYIARCADGSLYTGVTTDVVRRLRQHNAARGAAYVRTRRPATLAHSEPAPDRGAALRREHAIKAMTRDAKLQLISASMSPAARIDADRPGAAKAPGRHERNVTGLSGRRASVPPVPRRGAP